VQRSLAWIGAIVALALASVNAVGAEATIPRSALKQGSEFTGADIRAMQSDEFTNPGMLWVTRGERLWKEAAGASAKSCASCHAEARDSMKAVATRYPRIEAGTKRLVNLSGQVNLCRERHQKAQPLAHESDALLGLTAFITYQSRGLPMNVALDGENAGTGRDQRGGQWSRTGAEIDDEVPVADVGSGDDSPGRGRIKPMPTPAEPFRPRSPGHGGPSRSTSS